MSPVKLILPRFRPHKSTLPPLAARGPSRHHLGVHRSSKERDAAHQERDALASGVHDFRQDVRCIRNISSALGLCLEKVQRNLEVSLIPDWDLARGKHIILQNQLKYHDSHQIFRCFALLRGAYCRRWHPKGP